MHFHTVLLTTTLLLFTACGGGGSSSSNFLTDNDSTIVNDENSTISYNDSNMSCNPVSTSNIFNKSTLKSLQIVNPSNQPKILVAESPSLLASSSLDFNKEGLYELFETEYYWADETPSNFDYSDYTSPQTLIDDLKNDKDIWSFAITKEDYEDVTSQQSGGFGFSCQDVSTGCHVTYVRIDSPVDSVGLQRGDVITEINEQNATQTLIYEAGQELEKLVSFKISRNNTNEECNCSVTPREYTYKVAEDKIVYTPNNSKVGYLRLDSFMGDDAIVEQIDEAFDNFKEENITKLVIDLRYNGGGSVSVASKLLDKLSTSHKSEEQFTLAWNDDYSNNNTSYSFLTDTNSLDLEQILFLTTEGSASASELVISAMKAYLSENNLVTIGEKTHGKPVGMGGRSDGYYYYFLINFVVKNSLGFYDYFEGLPVTDGCNIEDDPFHEMGDTQESMLKAALLYIDTGSCQ